jgi:hypothetical protein
MLTVQAPVPDDGMDEEQAIPARDNAKEEVELPGGITETVATFVLPFQLAETSTVAGAVTDDAVAVKATDVAEELTVADGGTVSAGEELDSTTAELVPGAPVRVTVQVAVVEEGIWEGEQEMPERAGGGTRESDADFVVPPKVPEIVAVEGVAIVPMAAVKDVLAEPAAIVMEAGTVTIGDEDARVIVTAVCAEALSVAAQSTLVFGPADEGLQVTLIRTGAAFPSATVADAPLTVTSSPDDEAPTVFTTPMTGFEERP